MFRLIGHLKITTIQRRMHVYTNENDHVNLQAQVQQPVVLVDTSRLTQFLK